MASRPKRVLPRRACSLEAENHVEGAGLTRPKRKRVSPKRDGMLEGEELEGAVDASLRQKPRVSQRALKEEGREGVVSTQLRQKRVSPKGEELEGVASTHPRRKRVSPIRDDEYESFGEEEEEEEEEEWVDASCKRSSSRRRRRSEEEGEGGGIKPADAERRRQSITMRLATSESKVIR